MCESTASPAGAGRHAGSSEGCYLPEGKPVKCRCCGSSNITSQVEAVVDVYAGMGPTSEESYACGDCNAPLAYWVYGSFDPSYLTDITAEEGSA